MEFVAAAEHYERFMGRYLPTLAPALIEAAGVTHGRVVDVGCGPGGLTAELAARVGADNVAAIDPAPQFVAACGEKVPGADVRKGVAESLPWGDGEFDAALSSLVIAFMKDPDQGVREMARVVRPGGTVAACMWDIATGGMTMLTTFWAAAREVDPTAEGERRRAGTSEGDLAERFGRAGLGNVEDGTITANARYESFDSFWEPFTHGVGPAGQYLASLEADQHDAVREATREKLPEGAFSLEARAWYARGVVTEA
jgi:ubiquinone/menaquinone biosynthesis C-methylase UbiE